MNPVDWLVMLSTLVGIAVYGIWRTRTTRSFSAYFKGNSGAGWPTIGLSVMATQASAITFLSIPGQAYESGIGFVQNYFGLPLALIIVCAVFLPIYRRLGVYTSYEYLGRRFDGKTRLLGAGLFLLQRGLSAGITIYAPAIILSTVLGWRLDLTIISTGLLVILYTVTGGSEAVSLTQRWQIGVIFAGMATAFLVLLFRLPAGLGFLGAVQVAGASGKLKAVDFSFDLSRRYTLWSGLLGGLFLSLSYFGTDQSQVQRYIGGAALREGRLGLMFNGVLKIPMQFLILLLGALVFVFYQFEPPPVFFNQVEWSRHATGTNGLIFRSIEERHKTARLEGRNEVRKWLEARSSGNPTLETMARQRMAEAQGRQEAIRAEAKAALVAADPAAKTKDSDYVFITFILSELPHGAIGLLIAVMISAALSSKASELNALAATTMVDLWRPYRRETQSDEGHEVRLAKWFTAGWGLFAIAFALFASMAENLIEATNILGSLFYGVTLGIFLVAFFLKLVGGTAVFWGALIAQTLVVILYRSLNISYLWYNLIGCLTCVAFSGVLQCAIRFMIHSRERDSV